MHNAERTRNASVARAMVGDGALVRRARYLMGTLWVIEVETSDIAQAQRPVNAAFDEVARIERWASRFLPESEVSRINAAAGGAPVACSRELVALLERCRRYTRLTEGAFDVTIGGAFADEAGHKTQDTGHRGIEQDRRRWVPGATVGDRHLAIDVIGCQAALRRAGMALDLGGVAKGYAVDRAVLVLRERGVPAGAVNAGGNLRLFGVAMRRAVAIRDPRRPSRCVRRVRLQEAAAATSGNYERTVAGAVGHLVDPATASAVWPSALSVTVVAATAEEADAYSTALFVMGPTRGAAWARRHGTHAVFVVAEPVWWQWGRVAVVHVDASDGELAR